MSEVTPTEPRRLAAEARDRVRFEEEALELADQVYRVARRLVGSREEAEDLMQETYARAFRSWRSYTPGTNLRAWLLRILSERHIRRGRRPPPAPPDPHHRPCPPPPARAPGAAARGRRLLPLQPARAGGAGRHGRGGPGGRAA